MSDYIAGHLYVGADDKNNVVVYLPLYVKQR